MALPDALVWGHNDAMNPIQRTIGLATLCGIGCLAHSPFASADENATPAATNARRASLQRDGQHDFDFNLGTWRTHVSRLLHPLTGSTQWVEYRGVSIVRPVWNGRGNLFELEVEGPAGAIQGLGLRLEGAASSSTRSCSMAEAFWSATRSATSRPSPRALNRHFPTTAAGPGKRTGS